MPRFQPKEVIAAISASLWLGLSACDSGAVGVESCREIEYARCSAAVHCPSMFTIKSQAACRRFYRDHCLHGLPLAQDPGSAVVSPCVTAIRAIGECAGESWFTEIPAVSECSKLSRKEDNGYYATLPTTTTPVCELIRAPENIPECSFLNPSAKTDAGTTATGGSAATGGAISTGGAAATGGSITTGGSAVAAG